MTKKNTSSAAMADAEPAAAIAALQDLENTADNDNEYQPDLTPGGDHAATGPGGGDPGQWRPNPQRIERMRPKIGMFYMLGCRKVADAQNCPALEADGAEVDAMSLAIAELLDACLPPDTGEVTRGGVIFGSLMTAGGIVYMKSVLAAQYRAERERQTNENQSNGGGDDSGA